MKIRTNFRRKILNLLEEKGYIIIYNNKRAIDLLLRDFPDDNYLDRSSSMPFIVIRKTFNGFDIGYRAYRFTYLLNGRVKDIKIQSPNIKVYSIEYLI